MSKLKQYTVAILKIYGPLILMFVCQDVCAIEVDGDAMDEAANKALKYINGYGVAGISLVAFAVGACFSVKSQTGGPISMGSGLAAAVPVGWLYYGGGKTLLLGM